MEESQGRVIWFTGLSGSGKSTLCNAIYSELQRRKYRVQILDGDELRRGLCSDLAFTDEDRNENIRRIVHLAALLAQNGITALVAAISPFEAHRARNRLMFPSMVEVFVDAPLSVCEQRDPKGLYKRARAGELRNFTGIDSPFEPPLYPDVTCRTDLQTVEQSTASILSHLFGQLDKAGPASAKRRSTIAVDFDGVIANYDGWSGEGVLGTPRPDVVAALHHLRAEGWKIIIHTTRGAEEIGDYLVHKQVPFDEINQNTDYQTRSGKPVATVYWDDRALTYSGDAISDLAKILSFRTWNDRC